MSFWIQVSTPRIRPSQGVVAEDLAAALQLMYVMETEDAVMSWNGVRIAVGYKYDLSIIIEDVLSLLLSLASDAQGEMQVLFGSDTLRGDWRCSWTNGRLEVLARWDSLAGNVESAANACARLEVGIGEFLAEWRGVLQRVASDVERSGIFVEDQQQLRILHDILNRTTGVGRLYAYNA